MKNTFNLLKVRQSQIKMNATVTQVSKRYRYKTEEEMKEANRKRALKRYHDMKKQAQDEKVQRERFVEEATQWYQWFLFQQQQNPGQCPLCSVNPALCQQNFSSQPQVELIIESQQ